MKPEDIRLYGDPSTRWQKVLDDYLLTQGNNKKGIFSTMGPEKLSDSSDSVTRVTLEYTLEGVKQKPLKLIERSLSSKKYKHKNPSRIENETFFIKNIPELLRNMRFQGLPITHLCYELKNKEIDTVFYQEDVGEYNLKELFSSLSKNATNLEKELVEKNAKPLKSIDKKVLEELQSFRKVDIYEDGGEGFIVKLKPKVIKLFNEEELPNYLKFVKRQPEDTYEKVIDLIREFNFNATKLWETNDHFSKQKSFVLGQDDVSKDFKVILQRIKDDKEIDSDVESKLINIFDKEIVTRYIPKDDRRTLLHGDSNVTNICIGPGGHSNLYLTDLGHLKIMNNNYIDYVNVLRDLRKYCGMQKVQYDKLLKDVMGEFPNENKRYLTELYNDLDVFGMLNKRSKIANEEGGFFGEQQKISLEKSRKLYKASLKDLLNNWKDTSEFKHNSFMNEFSDLMLNNYLN